MKRTLFNESDVKEVTKSVTASVDQAAFDHKVRQFTSDCPHLTHDEIITAVVANILFDFVKGGGLDEHYETVALELKKHYGYPSSKGHGVINCTVKEHKAKMSHFLKIPAEAI